MWTILQRWRSGRKRSPPPDRLVPRFLCGAAIRAPRWAQEVRSGPGVHHRGRGPVRPTRRGGGLVVHPRKASAASLACVVRPGRQRRAPRRTARDRSVGSGPSIAPDSSRPGLGQTVLIDLGGVLTRRDTFATLVRRRL